eukprot:gnl/TRDRNA2_/TRDRNA2_125158_c0_seq1.p1 gnl/TRDRNA2_/TRDRNA2_125158_c0~~gnl/TRDRNA2_/TRDRNA2_125158_c0_seq1.p1  ORF type:complete len:372 (+),score=42.41 gnl/TRDRNA2_/TRDRNA2_125158_c0_seq1:119-1117(+)
MRRLVQWADIVVENFRSPDVMKSWGYGYDQLRAWKSDIIYASNSSFGPAGPRAGDGSFDNIVQAYTGAAVANAGGPSHEPLRAAWNLADEVGAMSFTSGILMALLHKARTGQGLELSTSQTGAMIQMQAFSINQYTASGQQRDDGSANGTNKYDSGSFATHSGSDGKSFIFAAPLPKHWQALCRIIGRDDLIDDSRSKNHGRRAENRVWLWGELASAFVVKPRSDWLAAFVKEGIPVGACNDYAEVVREEQLWSNGYLAVVNHPVQGEVITTGKAFKFSACQPGPVELAPGVAQHTDSTLRSLGFTDSEIHQFVHEGVVTLPGTAKKTASKL